MSLNDLWFIPLLLAIPQAFYMLRYRNVLLAAERRYARHYSHSVERSKDVERRRWLKRLAA